MTSNCPYTKQSILQAKYNCYGHFYSIISDNGEFPCRSVLEIVDKSIVPRKTDDLLKRTPDLVAIMMNPGASKPVVEQNLKVKLNSIPDMKIELTDTIPDKTQFQIMRIMKVKNWTHTRILNLSDLRDPESEKFYKYYESVESILGDDQHTIFSAHRTNELSKKLNSQPPVLAAWGVKNKLNPLINKCMASIKKDKLIGIKKSGSKDKYYHPLLQGTPFNQKEWVEKMCKIIFHKMKR